MDQVILADLKVAFDDRIIADYRDVLSREKFGFDLTRVQTVVDHIKLVGVQVTARPLRVADPPNPSDFPFAEVAVAAGADALVTGNETHFQLLKALGVEVLSSAQLLEFLGRLAGPGE
jgi:predicted nucleic acid-binding protein